MNLNNWVKIIITLTVLIVFLVGFLTGYFYGDKSCYENPFSYGVKILNEKYNENLLCSCNSLNGNTKPFSFNEEGIFYEK
jgi:hypothetical protein